MTQQHHRRTRIVATLGPATDPPEVLEALLCAGVDVVRLNFSHGDPSTHVGRPASPRATRFPGSPAETFRRTQPPPAPPPASAPPGA